jgi:hypothetical protein
MQKEYLAPSAIVAFGFDNAQDSQGRPVKRATVTRLLAGLFGNSVPYINAWGRGCNPEMGGTGQENPIDWFERLLAFFFLHCHEAATLMVTRVQFKYEQLMNQTSQQKFDDAEMRERALSLVTLLHYAIETGDDTERANACAAFMKFGREGLAALNAQNVTHSAREAEIVTSRRYVPTAYPAGR